MALTGNTLAGTANGYRCRVSKTWYPTASSSTFTAFTTTPGVTPSISSPQQSSSNTAATNNQYSVCIKYTTPTNAAIQTITKLACSFKVYDRNTTAGTLYGSLRTVGTDGADETWADMRTNAIGSEASTTSVSSSSTSPSTITFTFSGTMSPGTSYYLYLYTKSTSDIYTLSTGSTSGYSCTATYTKKSYTVTYKNNGYGTAPSSQTKIYGESLTLASFIANQAVTGYKVSFNANGGSSTPTALTSSITKKQTEWDTSSAGTGTSYASGASYTGNAALTLYAIWSSTNGAITLPDAISRTSGTASYTVSYNANGGSSTPSDQTLTRTTPYTFNKWAAGSASGTQYAAGASYTPTAATTMYATWTAGTTTGSITLASGISRANGSSTGYKVTFDANGGSCSTTSLTASNTVSYTFKEWNTASDGSGTTYAAKASYFSSSDLSLYAIFDSSTTNGSITLPTPTRSGYEFVGWATSATATSGSTGSYTPDSDITLYAIWKQSYSTVYYNDNGNVVACCIYYNDNGTAVLCNVYYNNNGSAVQI